MFVASYARLPPGSRFHLSVNVQIFPCNAKNMGFLRLQSIFYGSALLLQRAVPPRYHSGPPLQCAAPPRHRSGPPLQCAVPPRPLYYNARHRLILQCAVPPRYRSGPLLQCAAAPRYRSGPLLQCAVRGGTARALYYNARYRRPVCVLQVLIGSE